MGRRHQGRKLCIGFVPTHTQVSTRKLSTKEKQRRNAQDVP